MVDEINKTPKKEIHDFGLSSNYSSRTQRILNQDGTFNLEKRGLSFRETFNFYHYLITASVIKFVLIVFSAYTVANISFGLVYYFIGVENLGITEAHTNFEKFLEAFFFSAQTLTTVGYGRISPINIPANIAASLESLIGLMAFALATGLIYGRFSRPVARIIFSNLAIIAPFQGRNAFQFRTSNKQKSNMIDAEVKVILSILEDVNGAEMRKFYPLNLEYNKINFFTSVWTVNHPINEDSPLYGLTKEDLQNGEAEFMITLYAFDDTFAQSVHSRYSYRYNEIIWGAKFKPIHIIDNKGVITIPLDTISAFEKTELPKQEKYK